jgi:hypothetical protein
LKSYGIEDQFSKSEYQKQNDITRTGIYEARLPGFSRIQAIYFDFYIVIYIVIGKYTPRQQQNHPAANPDIVRNWTKTIDLNNRSLRGVL